MFKLQSSHHKKNHHPNRRLPLIFGLTFIVLLIPTVVMISRRPAPASAAWYDESWQYRQRLDISNSSGSNQSNFQVLITFDTTTQITASKMLVNCNDIRFTDQGGAVLPFWIEPTTCNTSTTKIWVKVASIPTTGAAIYIYYGNPSSPAGASSAAGNVFIREMSSATAAWPLDDTTATQSYSRVQNPAITPTRNVIIASAWNYGSGWSSADNGVTVHGSSAGTGSTLTQNSTILSAGKAYQVTFTISNYVSGSVRFATSGTPVGTTRSANGTYTETGISTGTQFQFNVATSFTGDITNVSAIQLPIPSSGSTPTQLLADGTMETAGTGSWTVVNNATLSKQSTSPHAGSQLLRVAYNGTANASAGQDVMTLGRTYRITGYARSDGTGIPSVIRGATLWTGNTSTQWQPFDVIYYAIGGTDLNLRNNTSSGYVEFDDVTVSLDNSIRPDQVLMDADAEVADTSYWTGGAATTLSKQSGTPHGGSQVLRIARAATGTVQATQTVLTLGKTYRFTGYARSDGNATPLVVSSIVNWTGTTSTSWQYFDVTYVATQTIMGYRTSNATVDGQYTEFDDLTVTEVDPLVGIPTLGVTLGSASGGHLTNAYTFDGTNDNVNIYSSDLNSAFNPDEGTMVAWAKVSGAGVWSDATEREIVMIRTDDSNRIRLLKLTNDLRIQYLSGGIQKDVTSTSLGTTTNWFQIVLTWSKSSDQAKMYLNGSQVGSTQTGLGTWSGNLASTTVAIGAVSNAGSNPWSGLINDVRLYTRALSSDEIADMYSASTDRQAYYTENYPGKELVRQYNTSVTVAAPATQELGGGPVAWWKFNDGQGQTVTDSSPNHNDGTLGANSGSASDDPAWKTEDQCINNKCLFFDGSNDLVTVPDSSSLDITPNITLSAWFKQMSSQRTVFLNKRDATNINYQFSIMEDKAIQLCSPSCDQSIAAPITYGKWHFLTVTYNGTQKKFYLDGILFNTVNRTETMVANNFNVQIGAYTADRFNGYIDDVKIYNYARSAAQIKSDFLKKGGSINGAAAVMGVSDQSGLSDGLMGYWKMDESSWNGTASEVRDSSGAGNHGTSSLLITFATGPFSSNTLTDTNQGWTTNNLAGKTITITSGTDAGDIQTIASNTSNQITISGTWAVTPDATSYYSIGSKASTGAGKFGNGGSFTGASEYISFPGIVSNNDFTLAIWFKTSDTGQIKGFFGSSSSNRQLRITAAGLINFINYNTGYNFATANRYDDGVWHHLVATQTRTNTGSTDRLTGTIYVDGVQQAQQTVTPTVGTTNTTWNMIGNCYSWNCVFVGQEDEARIYNRALSPDEVQKLYHFAPGPIAHWKFEDHTGTSVSDSSGNAYTGTWNGTGSHWVPGKIGTAGNFNGTSDYVNYPINKLLGASAMTINAWFKTTATNGSIIAEYNNSSYYAYKLIVNSGKLKGCVATTASDATCYESANQLASTNNVNDGKFHFASLVYDGATLSLYVDGILVNSGNKTGTIVQNFNGIGCYIGLEGFESSGPNPQESGYFNGQIDDVRIYNYARTPAQVAEDMGARGVADSGGALPQPLAWYKFDEGSGTVAQNYGSGGTNLNGTLSGMAAPATATSGWQATGKIDKALAFDGSNDLVTMGNQSSLDHQSSITISAWIKTTQSLTSNQYGAIAGKGFLAANINGYGLYQDGDNSNKVSFQVRQASGNTYVIVTSKSAINDGVWHQVVGIRDDSTNTSSIYVDGVLNNTNSTTAIADGSTTNAFQVGNGSQAGFNFKGFIDSVKIYSSALTPDQVKTDYNAGASVSYGTKTASLSNLQEGLVGWWKMDEASWNGTTGEVIDSSGNGNHGTAQNSASTGTGKFGLGANFTAASSHYISVPNNASLSSVGTSFTVTAWVKANSLPPGAVILSKYNNNSSKDEYFLRFDGSYYNFAVFNGVGTVVGSVQEIAVTPTTGTWIFLVGYYDAITNQVGIYANGTNQKTISASGTTSANTANFLIGASNSAAAGFWDGSIDDVRVYNRLLSPAEVQSLYNSGSPGPVAYWKFEESTGTSVADTTGNNNTGTWNGTGSHWVPGKIGRAGNFNGTDDYISGSSFTTPTDITVEAWIKRTTSGTQQTIWAADQGNQYGTLVFLGTDNTLRIGCVSAAPDYRFWKTTGTIPVNTWIHIAITQQGCTGNPYFYINGVLDSNPSAASTGGTPTRTAQNISIGRDMYTGFYFSGQIDEVKVYNYARSQAEIVTDYNGGGPVAWYKFDECQGTTIKDYTGNGLTGTWNGVGGGTQTSAGTCNTSSTAWGNGASGKFNSSLNLDGTDDYVSISDNSLVKFGSNSMSVSAWVKTTSGAANMRVISKGGGGNPLYLLAINSGVPSFIIRDSSVVTETAAWTKTINDGNWHLMTGVRSGSTVYLYIDGNQVGTATGSTGSTDNTVALTIGQFGDGSLYYSGQVDDVRLYNYGLTAEQVRNLYNGGSSVRFGP